MQERRTDRIGFSGAALFLQRGRNNWKNRGIAALTCVNYGQGGTINIIGKCSLQKYQ
jgi:hypothetical protein